MRTQCQNHLKQMGLAFHNYESAHGTFPSGGWGYQWLGDPDRGFGKNQPGGWIFHIMPFVEQDALVKNASTGNGNNETDPVKQARLWEMAQKPVTILYCPARRAPVALPVSGAWKNAAAPPNGLAARTDYAANGGNKLTTAGAGNFLQIRHFSNGPLSYAQAETYFSTPPAGTSSTPCTSSGFACASGYNGIIFQRSQVRITDVADGTSNTYMIGERPMDPNFYLVGRPDNATIRDWGDDGTALQGLDDDNVRWTGTVTVTGNNANNATITATQFDQTLPYQDLVGGVDIIRRSFGSAHPAVFNMALSDGSVRGVSYTITPETHRRLGGRDDGLPVEGAF
jgi:hypothetical protein